MSIDPMNLGRQRSDRESAVRVKRWTREIWELRESDSVVVTELACSEPGCPPLETAVLIAAEGCPTVQHKLHLATDEIRREDLQALRIKEPDA